MAEDALIHKDSGRPLSNLQLLALLEEKSEIGNGLSGVIREIGKYRIDADHKIIEESTGENYYVETFENLCHELNKELKVFCRKMKNT